MKQRISFIPLVLAGLLILGSCEKEVFLHLNHEPELCLNCILDPDKTIEASLTLTQSINDTGSYTPVNDAIVELFENDVLLGPFTFSENGKYTLNKKPVSGRQYRISVQRQGIKTINATTLVPRSPVIGYEKINYRNGVENLMIYDLKIDLIDSPGSDYYWLYRTGIVNGRKFGGSNTQINAPYIDNFNKEYDNSAKFGYTYFMQIRMTDEGYDGQVMNFTIPDILESDNKHMADQHFLSADEHYDKYIKTTIINRMKEESELPFYEPIQTYSNIENGTGIFGSCAVTTVKL